MIAVAPPAQAPGYAVDVVPVSSGKRSALRSDIAGFLGRTRRGPMRVGDDPKPCRVRVQGQRGFDTIYGSQMLKGAITPYSVNGYFENDGQIAHIIRLGGPASKTASTLWDLSTPLQGGTQIPGCHGFNWSRYQFYGSSPGCWANGAQITLTYSRQGVSGTPSVDVLTQVNGETPEAIRGVLPEQFAEQVNAASSLIRVSNVGGSRLPKATGLGSLTATQTLTLSGGQDDPPVLKTYLDAIQSMSDEPEVALVAMPNLYKDICDDAGRLSILAAAVALADQNQDRLVLVDVPPKLSASSDIIAWVGTKNSSTGLRQACKNASAAIEPDTPRSAVVYHPYLWAPDPLGTTPDESRILLPPSGHVAGLISRLDRQRGAYYTPANAQVLQAFDIAGSFRSSDRAVLNDAGVNLIRSFPNQGLLVWGGRTLGTNTLDLFVAYRRLLNRLVRAIRAVAEPLVFDVNGPELWLALVRAITSVLLQAYRGGGLAGATPDQAFKVQCDDQTNTQDDIDAGRVLCLVSVAPAVPMEFIQLQISLDTEGRLQVQQ